MADHQTGLAHHFEDMEQQQEAAQLGMWAFLITEILFFGGLFASYTFYRFQYPLGFAEGCHHLDAMLGASLGAFEPNHTVFSSNAPEDSTWFIRPAQQQRSMCLEKLIHRRSYVLPSRKDKHMVT